MKLGLGGLRLGLSGSRQWKRADIEQIRELVNKKSNEELAEFFKVTMPVIAKVLVRYKIKRDIEFQKKLMSHKKEEHPMWKDGISTDNYHYKKLQVERYPEKVKARETLKKAIKKGDVIRKPCEFVLEDGSLCGEKDAHGHHHDYTKPLDVRFLCRKHHRKIHGGTH